LLLLLPLTLEHTPDACEGAALCGDADVQLEQRANDERNNGLQAPAAAAAAIKLRSSVEAGVISSQLGTS
jgi:hypothetical protein